MCHNRHLRRTTWSWRFKRDKNTHAGKPKTTKPLQCARHIFFRHFNFVFDSSDYSMTFIKNIRGRAISNARIIFLSYNWKYHAITILLSCQDDINGCKLNYWTYLKGFHEAMLDNMCDIINYVLMVYSQR
jgi:hypothetical protein